MTFFNKRGQSANEAAVIISFMTFFLIVTLAAISDDLISASDNNNRALIIDMAYVIEQEAKIAQSAEGGYFHQFTLPPTLNGLPYAVSITNSSTIGDQINVTILGVALNKQNGINVTRALSRDVQGNLVRGQNTVIKEGGIVIFRPVRLSAAQETECGTTCSGTVTPEECCDHMQLCCG